jgi:hypothetical protein
LKKKAVAIQGLYKGKNEIYFMMRMHTYHKQTPIISTGLINKITDDILQCASKKIMNKVFSKISSQVQHEKYGSVTQPHST